MEGSKMEMMVLDHEKRIENLENQYYDLSLKMQSIETGQLRVEKTVIETSQSQQALLNKMIDKQFKLSEKNLSRTEKVVLTTITTLGSIIGAGGVVAAIQFIMK